MPDMTDDMTEDLEWAARIEPKTGERVGYLYYVGCLVWEGDPNGQRAGDLVRLGRAVVMDHPDRWGHQTQTQA